MFVLLLYFGHLCFVLILYIHFKDFYLFRAFFFEFVFIIPSYKCVFSRIFEFWCIEQRSYAEKGQAVLNSVIISIQNMGFASVLVYIIGYICKKIATYWVKNNRKKNFPVPDIEKRLQEAKRFKYFSSLDLNSGYYQIEVARK